MIIGIDASRAFLKNRTGIEEYSYQIIKNLRDNLEDHQVVLYVRKNQKSKIKNQNDNSKLKEDEIVIPGNWIVKEIKWLRFWTQIGLSLEMLLNKIDVLLIPAHTVPFVHPARNATRLLNSLAVWFFGKFFNNKYDWKYTHSVAGGPKNTVVVVHGLEYEFCPEAYSKWERFYMRFSIRNSCKWANKIISVSENTKKDLIRLYDVPEEKITVVYEGYDQQNQNAKIKNQNDKEKLNTKYQSPNTKYFLFIGRIEARKNIINVIEAFEIFKEKHKTDHKLVLAGRPGYGYQDAKCKIQKSKYKNDIIELGYVAEEEKWELLKNADAFIFATLYEGFGIPILEAQSVGCPVIVSNNSSIPEVVNCHPGSNECDTEFPDCHPELVSGSKECCSAILVNPSDTENIADAMVKIATNEELKKDLINKGLENVKRFSWSNCAREIKEILVS